MRAFRFGLRLSIPNRRWKLALALGVSIGVGFVSPSGIDASALAAAKSPARSASGASAALQQGIRYYNRGFVLKAIPKFEQATRQHPNDATAFLWLARAHRKQGLPADFAKAAINYQKVLAINPNQIEALTMLGEFWSWEPTRRADAINLLQKAHSLAPGNADISKKLAEALLWNGSAAEALSVADPIAGHYANDRHWLSEYAQMLLAAGRLDEAAALYETTLREETDRNPDVKMDLARLLARRGQMEKAHALFGELRQRVDARPASSEQRIKMAALAFDLGLYDQAAAYDESLPPDVRERREIQLRMAREFSKGHRADSANRAIAVWNHLYEAGLLSPSEKLEAADYLQGQDASLLPRADLVDALYRDAAGEAPENADVLLRLARRAAQNDPQDTRFAETVALYRKAVNAADSESFRVAARQEWLDYLKSDKTHPEVVEGLFKELMAGETDSIAAKAAYAEYVSWQPDRRPEALRLYAELAKAAPEERDVWEGHLEEVLKWHRPSTALIPVYQSIVDIYPNNKMIWLAVARAYRNDPNYYKEAVETYGKMIQRYADDATVKKEWLDVLSSNPGQRGENIRMLRALLEQSAPEPDPDVLATYGKLLSYEHHYSPALDAFEQVLQKNPEHRDALLGKGYVILWSGRKLEAKRFFLDLRHKYPDDVDIAIGLAQTDKMLGRYDEALRIMQEIKPLLDRTGHMPQQGFYQPGGADILPVVDEGTGSTAFGHGQMLTYDFSLNPTDEPVSMSAVQADENALPAEKPASAPEVGRNNAQLQDLRAEIEALSDAVAGVKMLQASSAAQLRRLDNAITRRKRESGEFEMETPTVGGAGASGDGVGSSSGGALSAGNGVRGNGRVGESGMVPVYGSYSALDYDTNPLLSGMGRFRNDAIDDLEKGLTHDLRPLIRAGYLHSQQDGNNTTTRISGWGFPNQLSFSLTPQIRLRGGIQPMRWYLPRGVSPDSSWGLQYGLGATVKYWDRLTLDGDIALTRFTQSQSSNITFQTQMQYDFNDSISAKLGIRRVPQYNSLLTLTGLQPNQGAFRGNLLGQARENGIYAELNTHPFTPNWDWNLGYEWAFIDGSRIPDNRKNQAFSSLGYTWHYGEKQQVRLGYEFLYFGYAKNATNGFFDTTRTGLTVPVVSLNPLIAANSSFVFGGYYSPHLFIMNSGRLDFRGSLFNRFLEYKLGGSLGAQTTRLGHHIKGDGNGTSLSSSFDANLILNFTDWLAAYGDVDFLNAGGQFNRWRFGGGLILRPRIDALSPVLGQAPAKTTSSDPSGEAASPAYVPSADNAEETH